MRNGWVRGNSAILVKIWSVFAGIARPGSQRSAVPPRPPRCPPSA